MVVSLMALTKLASLLEHQEAIDEELKSWLQEFTELRSLEPESHAFLPNADLMREAFDERILFNINTGHRSLLTEYMAQEVVSIPLRAAEAGLLLELKQLLGLDSADTSENSETDIAYQAGMIFRENLAQKMISLNVRRCFFATKKAKRFGIGSASVKTGDEVWILHGASKLVLLRPLENGNYEFLGATYVHGIMGDWINEEFGTREVRRVCIE